MAHPQVAILERHIRDHALDYFPDLDAQTLSVTLNSVEVRLSSDLLRFRVADSVATHAVLAKIRRFHREQPQIQVARRPVRRIADPEQAYWMEYAAMKAIYEHFSALDDPRFGAVRVLDALPEISALIMIDTNEPDLRPSFVRRNRLAALFQRDKLYDVFRNAGAWLRTFHTMPLDDHVERRHATRDDYACNIDALVTYLVQHVGDRAVLHAVRRDLDVSVLPGDLPLARGHGDFSLRNILVGENNRVTIIDTLARWELPIYHDIGYFLVRLHTNRVQVYSQGFAYSWRWLARCEEEFLTGYFATERVPTQVIKLYQIQALLNHWASVVEQCSVRASSKNLVVNAVRCSFSTRLFERILQGLLREVKQRHDGTDINPGSST